MSTEERIGYLLRRFADNEASETEMREMLNGLREEKGDAALESVMKELFTAEKKSSSTIPVDWRTIWNNITQQTQQTPVRKMIWIRIAAASVILLLLSVGGYFYFKNDTEKQIAKTGTQQQYKNDVAAPQTNKAVLTLSDGTTIVLDSAGNGSLAVQGNVNVIKTADGQIVYNGDATEIKYNTLTVPKGSKPVQLQLADGSNVWLNVASSITYPTAFINKERKVQITGEAYFEVAHNAAMPFVVQKNDISVQVLGTHFNVNTYDDENEIKITLLEGSVKVSKGNKTNLIKPGQQAQVASEIKVITADVDEVMAWKNGLFSFNKADLQTVLRQLTKWYDVEVVFQGNIPKQTFGGDMERTLSLAQVLKILEKSEVHFKIDGKKIIVMP